MHMCRRNLDVNILMFNNRIYGLTKGQYSPTSERGKVTKSTPMGSVDHPVNPLAFVLSCGASFVGRCLDVDAKNLMEVIERAVQHRGTSFVEIFQNCNVFNDRTHAHMSERSVRKERQVHLVDGELAVFGDAQDKVLAIERDGPLVLQRNALSTESPELHYRVDCFAHAMTMATLDPESFPIPMGVLYQKERETFDHAARSQVIEAIERRGAGDLEQLVYGGDTWTVDG